MNEWWCSSLHRGCVTQMSGICASGISDMEMFQWVSTWYIVSKAHSGECDDYKVQRLRKGPGLHFLKHHCWHCQENQTANQDGENGWDHTHSGRPDHAFLWQRENGKYRDGIKIETVVIVTFEIKNNLKAQIKKWKKDLKKYLKSLIYTSV